MFKSLAVIKPNLKLLWHHALARHLQGFKTPLSPSQLGSILTKLSRGLSPPF